MRALVVIFSLFQFFSVLAFSEATVFTVGERAPSEIIVKYKNGGKIVGSSAAISTTRSFIRYSIGAKSINKISKLGVDHIKISSSQNLDKTIDEINSLPDIEYAEPNYLFKAIAVDEDVESKIPYLESNLWGLLSIEADEAWKITTGGEAIVAVIDSGIDYEHENLVNNIWVNETEDRNGDGVCTDSDFDGIDQDNNGYVDDCNGWNFVSNNNDPYDDLNHGTHVAGIIGGDGSHEIFGVSRVIKLMAVKFIDSDGYGKTSDAINGIIYAVKNGAKILNNSWGGNNYSKSLKAAIEYANSKNSLFLAAAGNSADSNDRLPHYPSNYGVVNVVSVSSINQFDDLSYFSNYGNDSVDVAAPGEYIYSTVAGNGYSVYSGTSMATPFVSGIAALVLAVKPNLNVYDLKRVVLESTEHESSLSGRVLTSGRVNAANALNLALGGLSGNAKFPMVPQAKDPNERGKWVSSPVGCGRINTQNPGSSDMGVMIFIITFPLILVITRKLRFRALNCNNI